MRPASAVSRAMSSSSSVGTTNVVTAPSAVLIRPRVDRPWSALAAAFESDAEQAQPGQDGGPDAAVVFSPMPPVNTIASIPPRTTTNAPTVFAAR